MGWVEGGENPAKDLASVRLIKRSLLKEKRSCLFTSTEPDSVSPVLCWISEAQRRRAAASSGSLRDAESFAKESDGR